ncbi:hypothetical protein [Bifidobacterium castoris]|uniref:Beta-carotene 15,15'-monooxygenase n=1 Tax=Bifidobacterium castoris TaxID=2306972 RepID=A0A430F920_9BIFI|nr:hypothetical protein [Bifidobacterium castoris]RSX49317.1 beta-carotene 15,15'-monooxygenase [Bifidobacterium castoris]
MSPDRLHRQLRMRRPPVSPVALTIGIVICCGCAVGMLMNYLTCTLYGFERDTIGFLRVGAAQLVLPASLTLACLLRVEYRAFALVRHDPRTQLTANLRHIMLISLSTAVCGVALFALIVSIRVGLPRANDIPLLLITTVLTSMMNMSLALLNMLLVICGLPWAYGTAILIAFFVLARWMLLPLGGNIQRYVCFFWYPLSFDWNIILVQQLLPFIGYCIVMILTIVTVFGHRDRLET